MEPATDSTNSREQRNPAFPPYTPKADTPHTTADLNRGNRPALGDRRRRRPVGRRGGRARAGTASREESQRGEVGGRPTRVKRKERRGSRITEAGAAGPTDTAHV